MTVFAHRSLVKLKDPQLLVAVAKAVHAQALKLLTNDEIPRHYCSPEIYEPATEKTTLDGRKYFEISSYSDGFGASLFVLDSKMLFLSSAHDAVAIESIEHDRDLYLESLLAGLPRDWGFVVDQLQTEDRFQLNPPVGVFWFNEGLWHITDLYPEVINAKLGEKYFAYQAGFNCIDETDLSYLFTHQNEDSVNQELVLAHFEEWRL